MRYKTENLTIEYMFHYGDKNYILNLLISEYDSSYIIVHVCHWDYCFK